MQRVSGEQKACILTGYANKALHEAMPAISVRMDQFG
jgi:hypothetical protein